MKQPLFLTRIRLRLLLIALFFLMAIAVLTYGITQLDRTHTSASGHAIEATDYQRNLVILLTDIRAYERAVPPAAAETARLERDFTALRQFAQRVPMTVAQGEVDTLYQSWQNAHAQPLPNDPAMIALENTVTVRLLRPQNSDFALQAEQHRLEQARILAAAALLSVIALILTLVTLRRATHGVRFLERVLGQIAEGNPVSRVPQANPRTLGGFHTLFEKLDARLLDAGRYSLLADRFKFTFKPAVLGMLAFSVQQRGHTDRLSQAIAAQGVPLKPETTSPLTPALSSHLAALASHAATLSDVLKTSTRGQDSETLALIDGIASEAQLVALNTALSANREGGARDLTTLATDSAHLANLALRLKDEAEATASGQASSGHEAFLSALARFREEAMKAVKALHDLEQTPTPMEDIAHAARQVHQSAVALNDTTTGLNATVEETLLAIRPAV